MPELNLTFQCHLWAQNTFPRELHGARRAWHRNNAGFAGSAHTARESCTAGTVLLCWNLCCQCPRGDLGEDRLGQAPPALQRVTGLPSGRFAELGSAGDYPARVLVFCFCSTS